MKKVLMSALALMLLAGCGSSKSSSNTTSSSGYVFEVNGTTIAMMDTMSDVEDAIGEPLQDPEIANSCAFDGYDGTYVYGSYYIYTAKCDKTNNVEKVSGIDLKDDSVSTKEGIALGDSKDKVVEAYGDDYKDNNGEYVYTSGDMTLSFQFDSSDNVSNISYYATGLADE